MESARIDLTLKIWRQMAASDRGQFVTYRLEAVDTAMTFLEMMDYLNRELAKKGVEPVAFQHNCRQGICGSCGAVVNGQSQGPRSGRSLCQVMMTEFKNHEVIIIEPFRAKAFPVIKDLVVDRSALDRVVATTGYQPEDQSVNKEVSTDILLPQEEVEHSYVHQEMCIACGACVASCPNASVALFVSSQLDYCNKQHASANEKTAIIIRMVEAMDNEGFGVCTNYYECEAACPRDISAATITKFNREFCQKIWRKPPA